MSSPSPNKWLVAASVSFGTLMGAIDTSIVNVALSELRSAVDATVQEITWVSTGFVIANVVIMPLTAFLGRQFGQKRVYLFCLGLFLVGSALCGVAWSLPSLVAFRFIQGLGAGALQPTEQAILRQTFSPKEQGMATAVFSMVVMIGPAVGPTLGGYIVDNWHWSWIFFINIPIGILGFFLVMRFVHEPEDLRQAAQAEAQRQRKHFDWQGIALMCMGLAALQYVLEEGQADDWFQSPLIVAFTLLALFSLAAFIIRELTAKAPVVNIRLFKDPVFASGTVVTAILFAVLMSCMFLLPLFMQELLGFTATQSGLTLLPRTLVMLCAMLVVGRHYQKISPRLSVGLGFAITALGTLLMGRFTLDTYPAQIWAAIGLQGLGMGLVMVPLNTAALSNISRHQLPDATGLFSLMRQIGSSVGLAVFATLLSRGQVHATAAVGSHLSATRPEVLERISQYAHGMMAKGMDAASAQLAAFKLLSFSVMRQASVLAFDRLFTLAAVCCVAALPLVLLLRPAQKAGAHEPVHVEVEL